MPSAYGHSADNGRETAVGQCRRSKPSSLTSVKKPKPAYAISRGLEVDDYVCCWHIPDVGRGCAMIAVGTAPVDWKTWWLSVTLAMHELEIVLGLIRKQIP